MPNQIPWTPQQLEFYSRLESTDDSVVLLSVAGSGKTTSLVEGASRLRGTTLAVAFNVKIKKTLHDKIGHFVDCKTLNGLGHRALMNFFNKRITIDRDKVHKLVGDLISKETDLAKKEKRPDPKLWPLFGPIKQIVARAKSHGLVPSSTKGLYKTLVEDTYTEWELIAEHYDIPFDEEIHAMAHRILVESIYLSWNGICDFDDQVYLPATFGMTFDKYDNVIIDEAQDLSEIQHVILRKVLKKNGRLIAVGDENQAIYGWRGAMSNSIEMLSNTFDLHRMDLTISFRCAQSIVWEAQKMVARIEASESAPLGTVESIDAYDETFFTDGDVILCRNNAPLIKMAYRLISKGQGVFVMGRDIGYGLKALVKKLMKNHPEGEIVKLAEELWSWHEDQVTMAMKKEDFSKASNITDKAESLQAVIEFSNAKDVKSLLFQIDTLFGKESAPITLASVHKAKGLEWPRVYILNEDLMPSKWAIKAFEKNPERYAWMMQEETNIRYVAVTRAMQDLRYITTEGWEG